jgi:hypothetical protein
MDLLAQLRDIHLPPPISIWPFTLGRYILMLIIIILLSIGIFVWIKYLKKTWVKKIVLKKIESLEALQQSNENISEEFSMLLKRAALAIFSRRDVAALYGEEWLLFLDKTSGTTDFSQGVGRLLITSPYQKQQTQLPTEFFNLIKHWVKENL